MREIFVRLRFPWKGPGGGRFIPRDHALLVPQHHAARRNPLSAEWAWVFGTVAARRDCAGHLMET